MKVFCGGKVTTIMIKEEEGEKEFFLFSNLILSPSFVKVPAGAASFSTGLKI